MPTNIETYLGNQNLKKQGVKISWTPEMIQEYVRCASDPIYFAENYVHIVHVDHGFIKIQLYDYQKEIIEKFHNNRKIIVTQSRQSGKTTAAVVVILHYILFNNDKTVALLANKGDTAREILSRIQLAYEALPKWLQQGIVEWNKGSVTLENNCKVIAAATSSSAIRGRSCSVLYIDECSFVEGWEEFSASVLPTISSGNTTKLLYTSTPNGLNHFYKTWVGAKENRNGFAWVEVPWHRVPGRDEKWKQEVLSSMDFDYEKFSQEYELVFHGSSGTLVSGETLKSLVYQTPIVEREGISQYEKPQKDRTYVAIVDVSRGKGLDYSAFQIIDITEMPYRQVCVFRDNFIGPIDYAEVLHTMCKLYNEAYSLIEINDLGQQVADVLFVEYEYENILYTETAGRSGKRISSGFGKNVDRGIRTTKSVKSVGCSILKLLLEQKQLIINDFDTIQELSTFSKKGASYEAESGAHDDLVMCLVLFAWLTDQNFFKELTNLDTIIRLREKTKEQIEEDLLPFGFSGNDLENSETREVIDLVADNWTTF